MTRTAPRGIRRRSDADAEEMKVKVSYTVDVDRGFRRALVHHQAGGQAPRLATPQEVRDWCVLYGMTMDDHLRAEHGECCWHDEPQEGE